MLEHNLLEGLQSAIEELPDAVVRDILLEAPLSKKSRPDAMMSVDFGGRTTDIAIETMKTAYPRDVREKIWQIRQYLDDIDVSASESIAMLIADTISKGARELLKEANIGYYDASGSLYLPSKTMYILVDRPAKAKARKLRDAIFKGQRAQVLHFLFNDPNDWLSVKEVAASTGISAATVSETLSELERREWVKTEGNGPSKLRKLSAKRDLLDAWSQFIIAQKPPETERYYVPGSDIEIIMKSLARACKDADVDYAISGEAAAQIYNPYLSHISRLTCRMAQGRNRKKALEALDARPVSEGWNFAVYAQTKQSKTILMEDHKGINLAPPLQVFLDLLQGGGRSKEMAQHLRETILRD